MVYDGQIFLVFTPFVQLVCLIIEIHIAHLCSFKFLEIHGTRLEGLKFDVNIHVVQGILKISNMSPRK